MKFTAKFLRNASQLLYHGSQKKFPVGFVLLPQSDGYAASPDEDIANTERVLEAHRPAHCLPRNQSVFMVANPDEIDSAGGYLDFVYTVEPVGKVEKNDMDWYVRVACVIWDDVNHPEAIRLSKGYWSGKPWEHNSKHSLFEYRAQSAEVVQLVEENE